MVSAAYIKALRILFAILLDLCLAHGIPSKIIHQLVEVICKCAFSWKVSSLA